MYKLGQLAAARCAAGMNNLNGGDSLIPLNTTACKECPPHMYWHDLPLRVCGRLLPLKMTPFFFALLVRKFYAPTGASAPNCS